MKAVITAVGRVRREVFKRFKILLLFAFPFADQITGAIASNLPIVSPFIPENIYKWVGPLVVLAAVLRDVYKSRQEKKRGR
jgi:hypothetical protein